MKRSLALLLLSLLGACGGTVDVPGAASGSTGSGGGTSTGAGGSGGGTSTGSGGNCGGSPIFCADGCGSDYFPAQASCVGGAWVCPPGTVDPATCPSGTCWGLPLPCEGCGPTGWECQPTEACLGSASCGGLVCAECPKEGPSPLLLGACSCACDSNGQFSCGLAPGCCNSDMDCGDKLFAPCVQHVCKQPVPTGCWADAQCAPGEKCVGATVCPCDAVCDGEDQPGTCVAG